MHDHAPNHLAGETSPYLLQHLHNPVDWYPWGPTALARARALDRPILLSIGYAACHWCHVMERESFVDAGIAALMNAHYVCIKVDREERPDVDAVYMAATQAMNHGHGGWPMTVFLTPDQEPFFAGTYFPPYDHRHGPGFRRILEHLAALWQQDRAMLLEQAQQLTDLLRQPAAQSPSTQTFNLDACMARAVKHFKQRFDAEYGGFGPAPKFPPATTLRFLMAYSTWNDAPEIRSMVCHTLDGMSQGGMFDLIGGGFSRYATDVRWHVPHFEKMLYDNALLAEAYSEAYALWGEPRHAEIVRQTLDFALHTCRSPHGGFYAAWDADSEGEEGKFYTWTPEQVQAAMPNAPATDVAAVCAYYGITAAGNWQHGVSIARADRQVHDVAAQLGLSVPTLEKILSVAYPQLYAAREKRPHPQCDTKVLTAWNGLMLSALAAGARVLGEDRYLKAACTAAAFMAEHLVRPEGRLWRSFGGGRGHLNAYLEDYAFFAEGLVNLYEAGAPHRWLILAQTVAERMLVDFCDPQSGMFFDTAHDHETLLLRSRESYDGAIPSAHAAAAHVLARLAVHTGQSSWREAAERSLAGDYGAITARPYAYCRSMLAAAFVQRGPTEYTVLFPATSDRPTPTEPKQDVYGVSHLDPLWQAVQKRYEPTRVLAHGILPQPGDALPETQGPLLAGKTLQGEATTVYICRNRTCGPPITSVQSLEGVS